MNSLPSKLSSDFRQFYERVGTVYPEDEIVYNTLRGSVRRDFVLGFLEQLKPPFLDLGCNRGYYLSKYRPNGRVGVDIAFSVLSEARQRCENMKLVQGDGQDLSFLRSSSFNSILCSEVLEHVHRPQNLLHECFRVLKRGGRLLVTTPNYTRQRPTWVKVGQMEKYGVRGVDGDFYFHTAFRPPELKTMAEESGFEVKEHGTLEKEVKYATRIPVLLFHVVRFLNRVTLNSDRIHQLNLAMLERGSFGIYKICKALGLNPLLISLVKEGVRTYLVAEKS